MAPVSYDTILYESEWGGETWEGSDAWTLFYVDNKNIGSVYARNTLLSNGSFALAGQEAGSSYSAGSTSYDTTLQKGDFGLTGRALTEGIGTHLIQPDWASGGWIPEQAWASFFLRGEDVSSVFTRNITLSSGEFTFTGNDVGSAYVPGSSSYSTTLLTGTFSLAGREIAFAATHRISLASAIFEVDGNDIGSERPTGPVETPIEQTKWGDIPWLEASNWVVFYINGRDIISIRGINDILSNNSFSITGRNVTSFYSPGTASYSTTLFSGSIALAGNPVGSRRSYATAIASRSFLLAGNILTEIKASSISINRGTFSLTGRDLSGSIAHGILLLNTSFAVNGRDIGSGLPTGPVQTSIEQTKWGDIPWPTISNWRVFSINGRDIISTKAINDILLNNSFSFTGRDVTSFHDSGTLSYSTTLFSGSIALTRNPIASRRSYSTLITNRSFLLAGNILAERKASGILISRGTFSLAGRNLSDRATYQTLLLNAAFTANGRNAESALPTGPVQTSIEQTKWGDIPWQEQNNWRVFCLNGRSITSVVNTGSGSNQTQTLIARGSFTFSGRAALTRRSYRISVENGSLILSGIPCTFRFGRQTTCSRGTLSLSGRPVSSSRRITTLLSAGSFMVAGRSASSASGLVTVLQRGLLAFQGRDAGVAITLHSLLLRGSLTVTGPPLASLVGRPTLLSRASFSFAGNAVILSRSVGEILSRRIFTLSGQALESSQGNITAFERGQFVVDGGSISERLSLSSAINNGIFLLTGRNLASRTQTNRRRSSFYVARNGSVRLFIPTDDVTTDSRGNVIPLTQEEVYDLYLEKYRKNRTLQYPGVNSTSSLLVGYCVFGSRLDPRIRPGTKGLLTFSDFPEAPCVVLDTMFKYNSVGLIGETLANVLGDSILLQQVFQS